MNRRQFCHRALASSVALALPFEPGFTTDVATEIKAVMGTGIETSVERVVLEDFKNSLQGRLLLPEDAGYEQARKLWSGVQKRPAIIAQCTGAADVRTAVGFARQHNLLTAVKCGGHNVAGKGSCDDGLMIDLTSLRGVRVEPENAVAWVGGGSLLGAMDHETMAHGLVTTAGTVSHTGVGGLTLGGGFGRLARRFGLTLDSVKAVEIVTADGQFHLANAEQNEDLYWGCRGGGGNFGVVTAFQFQLHPMQRDVIGGRLVFPFDKARELVEFYGEFSMSAPDELQTDMVLVAPPSGPRMVTFSICYSGPPNHADRVLAPLRNFAKPIGDTLATMDYVELQRASDNTDPRRINRYSKGGFTSEIPSAMAGALVDNLESHPGRTGIAVFQQAGGAITRVAPDATAFAHRYCEHNCFVSANWSDDAQTQEHVNWGRQYWASIAPHTRGFYVNDMQSETQSEVNANYLSNYERLVRIKNRRDPGNLFRLNANVVPTV